MASCSGRDVSKVRHIDSSSSLSELEDDWVQTKVPIRKRRPSSYSRQRILEENAEQRRSPSPVKKLPEKLDQNNPTPGRELVTACLRGTNFVLPFEFVEKCLQEKLISSSKGCYPTEGHKRLDAQHQHDIVSLFFTPVGQESILQRKNLCGDFSVVKCKELEQKPDAKYIGSGSETLSMKSAKELKIDRTPFRCPISSCGDFLCVAFLSTHLMVEHSGVLKEGIDSGQPRSLLVDPKLNVSGKNHCNVVYYMATKLRDFGISEFKNAVPVLLMSSKFRFTDLQVDTQCEMSRPAGAQHHYMYWITGITSESLKIQYSLEIGDHERQSGWILPLGLSHDLRNVYRSGTGIIISQSRVDQLTRRKDKLLEMRLMLS